MKTKKQMADEAVYELLVEAFVLGLVEEVPDRVEYGVSEERVAEMARDILKGAA